MCYSPASGMSKPAAQAKDPALAVDNINFGFMDTDLANLQGIGARKMKLASSTQFSGISLGSITGKT